MAAVTIWVTVDLFGAPRAGRAHRNLNLFITDEPAVDYEDKKLVPARRR
jgi:hypothetical protein